MNNDIKRLTGTLLVSAAVLLAGCSKEDPAPAGGVPVPDLSAPVELSAGIETQSSPLAGTKAGELSGPVTEGTFPANTTKVFSLTAYAGMTQPTNWSNAYFSDIHVNSGTGMPPDLTLATAQYYPANGNRLYFYAYSPVTDASAGKVPVFTAGNGATKPSVSWTIDGKQDIMAASHTTGIAKAASASAMQTQPKFNFKHLLKQVNFKVLKDNTSMGSENVSLTKIEIVGVRNKAKLNIADGTLSFETATAPLTAYTGNITLGTTAAAAGGAMFEPGTDFTVTLTVTNGGTYTVPVQLTGTDAGKAGKSHTVTFTFKRNAVVPTATVTTWSNGDGKNVDVI